MVRAPLVSRPLAEKVNDELIFVFKFMKTRLGAENISLLHDPVTAASTSQHQSERSGLSSVRSLVGLLMEADHIGEYFSN